MKKGDIVLIVFPFTDLSGTKLRPALVLAESAIEVTVVFITSQSKWMDQFGVDLNPDNDNGIKKSSIIRVNKIATLDKQLAKGKLGFVEHKVLTKVEKLFLNYLQIVP